MSRLGLQKTPKLAAELSPSRVPIARPSLTPPESLGTPLGPWPLGSHPQSWRDPVRAVCLPLTCPRHSCLAGATGMGSLMRCIACWATGHWTWERMPRWYELGTRGKMTRGHRDRSSSATAAMGLPLSLWNCWFTSKLPYDTTQLPVLLAKEISKGQAWEIF